MPEYFSHIAKFSNVLVEDFAIGLGWNPAVVKKPAPLCRDSERVIYDKKVNSSDIVLILS